MKLTEYCKLKGNSGLALAKLVGVSQAVVSDWCRQRQEIPLERCMQIEQFTAGQVTCEEMRPDKVEYFAYMRGRAAPELAGVDISTVGDAMGYDALENKSIEKAA